MIDVEFSDEAMNGGMLYAMLTRHNLLSLPFSDIKTCIRASDSMRMGVLHDGGETPLAWILEGGPFYGVTEVIFITERARLNQRRDELIEMSPLLRDRWFKEQGARRVEAKIPVERTQSIRCLKHLGFRQETSPRGLRSADVINGKSVDICVMGLLPNDPMRQLSGDKEELNIIQEE